MLPGLCFYGIPFPPLTDEDNFELPQALSQLYIRLSTGGDLAYIEAEIFGGASVQAHVLVELAAKPVLWSWRTMPSIPPFGRVVFDLATE